MVDSTLMFDDPEALDPEVTASHLSELEENLFDRNADADTMTQYAADSASELDLVLGQLRAEGVEPILAPTQ